jgi:hypothetical protein
MLPAARKGQVAEALARPCESIRSRGYPFDAHEVETLCMFGDHNYNDPGNAPEYFQTNREVAQGRWSAFDPQLDAEAVCAAYEKTGALKNAE